MPAVMNERIAWITLSMGLNPNDNDTCVSVVFFLHIMQAKTFDISSHISVYKGLPWTVEGDSCCDQV